MRKAKLTADEIDGYLTKVAELPLPGDGAEQLVARLRPWAEADDGKPTYMLNLNRYFAELRPFPGAPELQTTVATPVEAAATTAGAWRGRGCGMAPIRSSAPRRRATRWCRPSPGRNVGTTCGSCDTQAGGSSSSF
jgi:hypothetical protein